MPSDRSILFFAPMAIAEPLSAAPPTTASSTMPMNTEDMPSTWPVPSAAPTRISLIQAASTEAPIRLATARGTLQRTLVRDGRVPSGPPTLSNEPGCVFSENRQVQRVERTAAQRRCQMFSSCFLAHGFVRREVAAEGAGHGETHGRQQHHRAVHARRAGVVGLVAVAQAAEQEGDAEREQEIRQDRADDGGAHHVEVAGAQRHQRDDELGRIAEGRIEQSAHRIAGVSGEVLGGAHDQRRDRHDRERRGEEDQRRRQLAGVLEHERDRE